MKRLIILVCLFAMALGVQAAKKQYRDFTDTKGRTIRGRVTAYDAKKGTVTFERDNRKTSKVPLTIFSETDQAYIRDWDFIQKFNSNRFLKIEINRKKDSGDSSQGSIMKKKVTDTHYEIQVENRSPYTFENLELKYGIYYEQEEVSGGRSTCHQGVYCDEIALETITPKAKKMVLTEAVSTYTQELSAGWVRGTEDGNYSDVNNIQRGEVHGIWVRVQFSLPSGQTGIREFCYPDSLSNSRAWTTSSIRVGSN